MTNAIEETITQTDLKRRTVIKGAAWSVPVIAAAIATPLAAASGEPPVANYADVTALTNPAAGSNPRFRAQGQVKNGNDYADGTLKAGELFTLTFTNGATATSYSNLSGLTYVSGNPATGGPVVFQVTAATSAQVSVTLNNVQPAGGVITATILNGLGQSTIS